ncbi:MAG: IMP cyclohydrolase [Victivallales bacterium]|jgi:IMP cyclohydrolase|nr:IMP cyclohydrolase [Victivallales bacterium]
MYVGRIVSVGMTKAGRLAAMYRVSSRSFPNREAKVLDKAISVLPKAGFEDDIHKNPYIAYNCLRLTGPYAVATNGSHTDPITEKLAAGMNMRDALVTALFGMDYEHDTLNTPRIASIVEKGSGKGYLGIVRHDAFHVAEFALEPGKAFYVCTYEHNVPCCHYTDADFDASSAADACQYMLGKGVFADLERPITAACAVETDEGFETAVADAPQS